MKEMSRYLLGVVTQSLWGASPTQRPIFNHAIECTWALLEFYMYAQFQSHDGATFGYMEDALHCFHTLKEVFLLRRDSRTAKADSQCPENGTRDEAKGRRGNLCWDLDAIQDAAPNECLVGSYLPRDTCFQGGRCQLQRCKNPPDVSLGRTDSLIRSVPTVFCPETGTSTWNEPQGWLERLQSQSELPAISNNFSASHSLLHDCSAWSPSPHSVSGEQRCRLQIPPFRCWSDCPPELPLKC